MGREGPPASTWEHAGYDLGEPVCSGYDGHGTRIHNATDHCMLPSAGDFDAETSVGNDLYVNIDRRLIKIDIPSIYLVEAKGDYIHVKTENQNYTVHSTLKKIEDKLPNDLFLKVHRSFIINVDKIIDIEDNSVLIKKDVIPVSRSNRPELMKRLNLL